MCVCWWVSPVSKRHAGDTPVCASGLRLMLTQERLSRPLTGMCGSAALYPVNLESLSTSQQANRFVELARVDP